MKYRIFDPLANYSRKLWQTNKIMRKSFWGYCQLNRYPLFQEITWNRIWILTECLIFKWTKLNLVQCPPHPIFLSIINLNLLTILVENRQSAKKNTRISTKKRSKKQNFSFDQKSTFWQENERFWHKISKKDLYKFRDLLERKRC